MKSRLFFRGITVPSPLSCQRDAADLLYGNAFSGILISIVASSFVVFAFENATIQGFKTIWWVLMTGVLVVRFADWFRWKKYLLATEYDGQKSVFRFIVGVNATALMWSVYAFYAIRHSELIETTAIIIIISAMAGGAATVLAAHKKTSIFYAFALLVPASISLLMNGEYVDQVLGTLGLSFSCVMLVIASKSSDFTKHAIALKNENALLVNHMERQVEQRTQKIYELSNLDPLTQLHNRTAFLKNLGERLALAQEEGKAIALLFIDLDGFKKVNDTFGHEVGDLILGESARRLRARVLDQQLLCRWGGDEFLIALEGVEQTGAIAQAYEFIEVLSQDHEIDDGTIISIGATVGVSLFPDHETSKSRLIQFADTAMYYQKKQRAGYVCVFTPEMEAQQRHELSLKNGLSEAVDKDQLRMVFQAIISSDTAEPVAFEALLRWQFGLENIPPDQFIGIAEQYGLINRIGAWVLHESFRAAVDWQEIKEMAICVNVSVIQLQDPEFLSILEAAVQTSGIKPSLIYLEITESVFASDTELMLEKIRFIQGLGIKVSIDDFGTGYSSLSAMQDLAVNTVKIDRSFINKLEDSGYAIVTAVIHAASMLGFDVVAEGVETELQWKKLADLGVHKQQGYFFSRPIEEDEVIRFIESKD